ncbi:MAG TPA: NUDIX hydrolase [Dongiaceae bacterium]|nr:NUDIX hydrolase [Dongiaceae bacterium]
MSSSTPIPSATVVLLRDTPEGLKVLLLHRNSEIAYAGSWVFPGGRIDAHEFLKAGDDALQAAKLAAVRETAEEAGIEVTEPELVFLSHWTTPIIRPKRFSTWFFLAPATAEDVQVDGGEIHAFEWHSPATALQARREGRIELQPPTFVTLTLLQPFTTVAEAMAHFAAQPPAKIEPKVVKTADAVVYLYNGDAGHMEGNPELPGSRHRLLQRPDGDWQYLHEI